MPNPRPNILLLMTDQHRGDCLGCDGHPVLETPTLDMLAAEGARFRHAYSAVPSCIPARATLLTGMNQWHTGLLGMGPGGRNMRDDWSHTLPGELTAAGYQTAGIGKMHFHPQRARNGFQHTLVDEGLRVGAPDFVSDYFAWFRQHHAGPAGPYDHGVPVNSFVARPFHLPEELHCTFWTAHESIQWLRQRDRAKPFFLKVSFDRPHSPYDPPPYYYQMYRDRSLPAPLLGDWAGRHLQPGEDGLVSREYGWCNHLNPWRAKRSAVEIQRARACYYGAITFIDHQISRLLATLHIEDYEAYRNTFIIFLSDHGDMLGDHHLWRKSLPYEGSARVPFLIRPPQDWDVPRGVTLDPVVELRDVMPTLLDAAGVAVPETCDGQSLVPFVRGAAPAWREYLHGEHVRHPAPESGNHYLTDGRWKYVWFQHTGTEQLFDLTTDPGECHDLAGRARHKSLLQDWRARLVAELAARDCGLVQAGQLVRQPTDRIIQSPHYGRYGCRTTAA